MRIVDIIPGMPRPASWQGPDVAYILGVHQKTVKPQVNTKLPAFDVNELAAEPT